MVDLDTRLAHALAALEALDAGTRQPAATQRTALRLGLSGTAILPLTSETMQVFAERRPEVELRASNARASAPAARGALPGPS